MSQIFGPLNVRSNSVKDILQSLTIGIVAFLASAHLLIRSSYHGLFSALDTVEYLSTAESLAAGGGLRDYSYNPLSWWPPFYSLLLALMNKFGIEVRDASRMVNIMAFGLIILLTGHWLSRHIKSRLLVTGAVIVVAASHILNLVTVFALSETLFVLLVLLALVLMDFFLNQRYPMKALILSAFFATLASMTRYAGIAVMLTVIFFLAVDWQLQIIKRLRYIVTYGSISFLPLLTYMTYSQIATGHRLTGRLNITEFTPLYHLRSVVEMLYVWFYLPDPTNIHALVGIVEEWIAPQITEISPPGWAIYYLWIVIGLIILTALVSIYHNIMGKRKLQAIGGLPKWDLASLRTLFLFSVYTVIYLLVLLTPFKGSPHINYRYLAPIYISILICVLLISERLLRRNLWGQTTVLKLILMASLAFGCVLHVNRAVRWNIGLTARTLEYSNYNPYLQDYTPNSPIIEYLNTNSLNGNILVNYVPIIYRLTDIPPPVRTLTCSYRPNQPGSRDISEPDYIILLIKVPAYAKYCDLGDIALQQYPHLETIVETSDGIILKINSTLDITP